MEKITRDMMEFRYRNNNKLKTTIQGDNKHAKKYMRQLEGRNLTEIEEYYWTLIMEMLTYAKLFNQEEKNEFVELVTEDYFRETGQQMKSQMLYALGDFILDDVLMDKDVDKISNNEYPILSWRQQKRREKREYAMVSNDMEFYSFKNQHNPAQKRRTQEKPDNK